MNNRDLAASLEIGPTVERIALAPGDGRAFVVAAYCVGQSSLLVPDKITFRDPGSPVWYIWIRPRVAGDGPSYAIPEAALARFVGPPARPDEAEPDKLKREEARAALQTIRTDADTLRAFGQAPRNSADTLAADYQDLAARAPETLGGYAKAISAYLTRSVNEIAKGAAAGVVGELPSWLLVGAILIGVGAVTVGAVSLARRVQ